MRQENHAATVALCGFGEERVARLARCGFDRHLLFLREHGDVCRAEFEIDLIFLREFFYKAGIGVAGSSAQLMIQMANDQFLVIEIGQPMEQRDGIAPARDADEIARSWRKSSQ